MSAFDLDLLIADLLRRIRILETTQPMGYSAVSEGRSRFAGNESVLVQGSGKVEGWWIVTGTQRVTGLLEGSGTLDWTGPWFLRGQGQITGAVDLTGALRVLGPWDLRGNGQITGNLTGSGRMTWTGPWDLQGAGQIKGNVDITGALDVKSRITLGPTGYLEAGTVRIDRGGTYGGRISSTGAVLALDAGGSVVVDAASLVVHNLFAGDTSITGDLRVSGTKNFRIPHPIKPDHHLLHGATESPVSGVEYWGEETLDDQGSLTVELPDYFEALTDQEGRAVLVTARGFVADWGDISDGCFTVTGAPGGRFSWLVKAVRSAANGGAFTVTEPVYGPLREAEHSVPETLKEQ